MLMALYVEYSNGNDPFSRAHTNVHCFGRFDNRIKFSACKMYEPVSGKLLSLLCSAMTMIYLPILPYNVTHIEE